MLPGVVVQKPGTRDSQNDSLEAYLQHLNSSAAYLVLSGGRSKDHAKLKRLILAQGLTILDERTFGANTEGDAEEAGDYLLKLQPCSVRELILELSAQGIQGTFKGYGGKA